MTLSANGGIMSITIEQDRTVEAPRKKPLACRRSNTLRCSEQERGLCVNVTLEKLMNWVPKGQNGVEVYRQSLRQKDRGCMPLRAVFSVR